MKDFPFCPLSCINGVIAGRSPLTGCPETASPKTERLLAQTPPSPGLVTPLIHVFKPNPNNLMPRRLG